mmetsp:Transcript_1876/g.3389  ORF Transcript_1876/g.3389 Transcript_1876/m.3389 type:complete len:588 (-) Transcript_1876:1333-3096(-)
MMTQYPQRPGEPDCRDFLRTGRCKYGDSCKYHHPIGGVKEADPNEPPFPIRPDEPLCQYYLKNGTCKFGQTCKFHHPPHMMGKARSVYNNSAAMSVGSSGLPGAMSNTSQGPPRDISIPGKLGVELPQRPSEPDCIYYLKHARCKYGATCKYHHPVNMHANVSEGGRYISYPHSLYQSSSGRERSVSGGSFAETRESIGALPRNNTSSQGCNIITNSIPQRSRQEQLDTISHSYQYHHQHGPGVSNPEWHRYFKHGTPDGSPKMGSPSFTSSTLASSYDTAVSNIEKLPQASFHAHNVALPRTLSGNSQHSRSSSVEDASLTFENAMILPSHEALKVPNARNYSHVSSQRRDDPYDMNGCFGRPSRSRIPSGRYEERTIFHQERQQEDLSNVKAPMKNVDDGLSMMTSALLTMLDTPANDKADAGTISTHSSNYEDAIATMNDPPFVSKSLPNYVLPNQHSLSNVPSTAEISVSRIIGPSSNGTRVLHDNKNSRNDFYTQYPTASYAHQSQQQTFSSESRYSMNNSVNHFHRNHSFDHLGMGKVNSSQSYGSGDVQYADIVADNQSRQWNPDSDTVGSVPTQFFLSP